MGHIPIDPVIPANKATINAQAVAVSTELIGGAADANSNTSLFD